MILLNLLLLALNATSSFIHFQWIISQILTLFQQYMSCNVTLVKYIFMYIIQSVDRPRCYRELDRQIQGGTTSNVWKITIEYGITSKFFIHKECFIPTELGLMEIILRKKKYCEENVTICMSFSMKCNNNTKNSGKKIVFKQFMTPYKLVITEKNVKW